MQKTASIQTKTVLFMAKGMIPITKNICVVDEQGNEYEATYPKRARGLVKNGRARFLSENKICLACPPDTYLEDDEMTNIEMTGNKMAEAEKAGIGSTKETENTARRVAAESATIDITHIFEQLKAIQEQNAYLSEAIEALSQMSNGDSGDCGSPGNIMGEAKAKALGDIVRSRETTNQRLLDFYKTVYSDLRSQS